MSSFPADSSRFSDLPPPPLRVIYSGRVQGVGFRWTCQSIAKRHPVTGTVQNLSDGTVELYVEGAVSTVTAFLSEIQQSMAKNIEQMDIQPAGENVGLSDFRILF